MENANFQSIPEANDVGDKKFYIPQADKHWQERDDVPFDEQSGFHMTVPYMGQEATSTEEVAHMTSIEPATKIDGIDSTFTGIIPMSDGQRVESCGPLPDIHLPQLYKRCLLFVFLLVGVTATTFFAATMDMSAQYESAAHVSGSYLDSPSPSDGPTNTSFPSLTADGIPILVSISEQPTNMPSADKLAEFEWAPSQGPEKWPPTILPSQRMTSLNPTHGPTAAPTLIPIKMLTIVPTSIPTKETMYSLTSTPNLSLHFNITPRPTDVPSLMAEILSFQPTEGPNSASLNPMIMLSDNPSWYPTRVPNPACTPISTTNLMHRSTLGSSTEATNDTTWNPSSEPTISATLQPQVIPPALPSLGQPTCLKYTPPPSNIPVSTLFPTLNVMRCQSNTFVDKLCYDDNDILLSLFNCDPHISDWVGIWLEEEDRNAFGDNFLTWVRSCGTQNCLVAPETKQIGLKAEALGHNSFCAYLINKLSENDPFNVDAISEPFLVAMKCKKRR